MRLVRPWPDPYKVNPNGKYGNRRHPVTGKTTKHRGLDVAYSGLVYAPADGEVVHKGADWHKLSAAGKKRQSGGNTLIVRHAPDLFTVYYHLREPSPLSVGAKVRLGDVLGHTGTRGLSTGVHIHWETRRKQNWGTDFDPHEVTDMSKSAADKPNPSEPSQPGKLVVDGILGRKTWAEVQKMLAAARLYKHPITGVADRNTIRALQEWLNRGGCNG